MTNSQPLKKMKSEGRNSPEQPEQRVQMEQQSLMENPWKLNRELDELSGKTIQEENESFCEFETGKQKNCKSFGRVLKQSD